MPDELPPIDPALRIASVQLGVSDLPRSVDFYERVLGLPLVAREHDTAHLGADGRHPALVLSAIERPTFAPARSTGLFHVAWLHPTRAALADSVQRVVAQGTRFDGASDHGVSEALYLHDPDGLGIELYADRPRELWQRGADGDGVSMVTLPLDLEDLLARSTDEPPPSVPRETHVGHIHLKVADVPRAAAYYGGALGFEEQAMLPSAAFLSAGGYHHHVGLNSWQSHGGSPPPDTSPGLRMVVFELGDANALEELEHRLTVAGVQAVQTNGADGRLTVRDPDGDLLAFTHR